MDRKPVNSRMMNSMGYDSINGILEIEFKSDGAIWQYFDVPEHMWNELEGAESQGKYWHAHIKDRFREARVG